MAGAGISTFTDAYSQLLKFGLMGFGAIGESKALFLREQVIAISMLVGQIIDPFKNLTHNWASLQK